MRVLVDHVNVEAPRIIITHATYNSVATVYAAFRRVVSATGTAHLVSNNARIDRAAMLKERDTNLLRPAIVIIFEADVEERIGTR